MPVLKEGDLRYTGLKKFVDLRPIKPKGTPYSGVSMLDYVGNPWTRTWVDRQMKRGKMKKDPFRRMFFWKGLEPAPIVI